MNYAELFDYDAQPRERVPCVLCGGWKFKQIKRYERYGFAQPTVRCDCGLVFLNPRMTAEGYAKLYQGAYRRLVSAWHNRPINAKTLEPEQRAYAESLLAFLGPHVNGHTRRVLDIGGSTGVVAQTVADRLGAGAVVIEPSPEEAAEAWRRGAVVIQGLAEQALRSIPPASFDLVLICQSIDHFLDPLYVVSRAGAVLKPGGALFVDIVDYDKTKESKVDHPYNFTDATIRALLAKAGFRVQAATEAGNHRRYLAREA